LAGRGPILLVLDNADRVVDELGTLARRWLTAAPNLMLLATSRTPLGVEAELVRVVEPLPVPASDATADEIGECLAVQLFLARARATQPTLALDEDTRDDLAEVVRMLDGLPLALELAAARARVLPPRALRARLDKHRLEVLASGRGTGRRAIRDALDASWDVLLTHERSALAQLSVFPHRFSLDQAEAVLALDDVWPLDIVTGLSDHSLVCIEEVAGQPWLRLYGSVRSYALEQSESLGIDRGALELRFIQAHVREPADVAAEVHGPNGQRVLDQLAEELDNRLEAVRIALGRGSPGLAAKVLRVAGHATHRGVPATLLAQHATAVLESGLEDGALRSAMLRLRGATSIPAGRWDVAEADAAEAARLADQTEDAFLRASAAALVAFVKAHRGEPTEAISACERALELARTAPNGQHWEGAALTALATARRRTQDLDGAEQAILSDLAIRRSIQDRNYEAYALQALASIEMARRNGDRARPMLEAALAIQREIGDRRAEGILLGNLGLVHHHARSWDDARTAMEAALAIHEEQGNARFQCLELGNLAAVALGRGDTARAMQFYEAAYGLAEQTNNPLVAGNSASALGEIALGSSDLDGADRWLHRAEQPLRQAGNPVYLARALWRRARLLAERADVESAGLILAEAEALVAPLGAHLKLAGRLADLRRQLFGSPPAASN
jgi:predicted ATPase